MHRYAKKIHVLLIIVGLIFISLSIIHSNLWFDETYSVSITNHSFSEIWTITANDVHPPLYYWMLRMLDLIFGENIIVYRIFSMIAIALFGILGYTHIRKDLGEKAGIIFSFLAFFLPIMSIYANQIRMYSWTLLFVTLMFIYANRIFKKSSVKNWMIFGVFSLASSYIHYYGLLAAGILNVIIWIYFLKQKRKKDIKIFFFTAISQVIIYLPWLYCFFKQMAQVSKQFWITLIFPKTFIEIVSFQFGGDLNTSSAPHTNIAFAIALIFYLYIGYSIYINRKTKESKLPIAAWIIYVLVIITALIISLKTMILYARYLFCITGLFIIELSYVLSLEKRKITAIILICAMMLLSLFNNISQIKTNYDESNMKPIEYLKNNIQSSDIIIYSDIGIGSVIASNFRDNQQYFYNPENWDVEEAYKAYAPQMKTLIELSSLDAYIGRIWLIDAQPLALYNDIFKGENYVLISIQTFETAYQNYLYHIELIER